MITSTEAMLAAWDADEAAEAALARLISSGLALIAVPLGTKGPADKGWNHRERAIRSPQSAGALVGRNVGLAHAYCSPTPTVAIDLDNCAAAEKWLQDRGIALRSLIFAPDAVVIHSGKRNSLKLLYRLPAGQSALPSKSVKGTDDGKMMIEFRCATADGFTVQDLIPPSVHPSGTPYEWIGGGDPTAIPALPACFLETWCTLLLPADDGTRRTWRDREYPLMTIDETPREVATMRERLRYVSADCDRNLWRDIVWAILSTHWKCAVHLAREWSMTAPRRYDEAAFFELVRTHNPNHMPKITVATIVYHARRGGWNG